MTLRRTGVFLTVSLGFCGPVFGCTFLVSFDNPDADSTAVNVPDATMDANSDSSTPGSDAAEIDSPSELPDATPGDDDSAFDGSDFYPFPNAAARPSGSSPLPLQPDGCEPCKDYATKSFTCGTEHDDVPCNFAATAIYQCPGGSTANEAVVVGYECPSEENCYPANGYAAVCDPCSQTGMEFVQQPVTTSPNNHSACIQCDAGAAVNIVECIASTCACNSDTVFPDGG